MHVTFYGVRGSVPAPGPLTARYGGNTSCVEVQLADGSTIALDAGTGLRALGNTLVREGRESRVHLLLSHTHWDHVQGLPFFSPLYRDFLELTDSFVILRSIQVRGDANELALSLQLATLFTGRDAGATPAAEEDSADGTPGLAAGESGP